MPSVDGHVHVDTSVVRIIPLVCYRNIYTHTPCSRQSLSCLIRLLALKSTVTNIHAWTQILSRCSWTGPILMVQLYIKYGTTCSTVKGCLESGIVKPYRVIMPYRVIVQMQWSVRCTIILCSFVMPLHWHSRSLVLPVSHKTTFLVAYSLHWIGQH